MSPAPAISLADGVYRIPTMGDFINSFAFVNADGSVTLVDCGVKRAPKKIVEGLAAMGKHPSDVTEIILTHAHSDHAGGAAEIIGQTGADGVSVHELEAAYITSGDAPPRDSSTTFGAIFARMPGGGFTPTPISRTLKDGDVLPTGGGLRIMHTPGHTPGHISLLHQSTGVLITGDAIWNMRSKMTWPIAAFCTSFRENKQTAHVLGEIEYAVAAFTHGPEIRDNAREQVRGFLTRARG